MNSQAEEIESKYPEILSDLRDHLTEILIEAGAKQPQAEDLAGKAAESIRKKWGGLAVYIPKGRDWELTQRDYEIYRKFNGRNMHQICQEFGITEQRVYQIVARIRAEETEKRQLKLFA